MATHYEKASEEVQKLFDSVLKTTSIPQWIEIELLSNNNQKQLHKINKFNNLVEKLTDGLNFAIIINEEIFEQLSGDMQKIAFVECLSGISVSEKDTVSLEKPDFYTYTGVLQKYGHESIIGLKETIKSFYDQKKQKEDAAKAAKKEKKVRKKKLY